MLSRQLWQMGEGIGITVGTALRILRYPFDSLHDVSYWAPSTFHTVPRCVTWGLVKRNLTYCLFDPSDLSRRVTTNACFPSKYSKRFYRARRRGPRRVESKVHMFFVFMCCGKDIRFQSQRHLGATLSGGVKHTHDDI